MSTSGEESIRRTLRRWRIAAVLAVLLFVVSALWSVYALVDAGITATYREVSFDNLQEAHALLERVALKVSPSTTRAELLQLLQELHEKSFEKEGAVHAGGLSFYFTSSGKLACITSTYPPDDTPCEPFFKEGS